MRLALAKSFLETLTRFPSAERTILSLQSDSLSMSPAENGWQIAATKDGPWVVLHCEGDTLQLCHADTEENAKRWATLHVLEKHPSTNVPQVVELPPQVSAGTPATSICKKLGIDGAKLLQCGVPSRWLANVLAAKMEEELLAIGEKLPPEGAEAVLRIAVGEVPEDAPANEESRSWWGVADDEELRKALSEEAWGSWCVYLHSSQKNIAERSYDAPFRVTGAAGTGKTVVALHHARYILRNEPHTLVLVTTFSERLQSDLARRLHSLLKSKEHEHCHVLLLRDFAKELLETWTLEKRKVLLPEELHSSLLEYLRSKKEELPKGITPEFAASEFEKTVSPRNISSWEEYRNTKRRKVLKRLAEEKRLCLWRHFSDFRETLHSSGAITQEEMYGELSLLAGKFKNSPKKYSHIIVDESQDLCEAEVSFLAAYGAKLFFAGDIGQRIVRYPFAWKPLGIDLRGKSRILKVNYRTTRQIKMRADKLMDVVEDDPDGISQTRGNTISLLSGPTPVVKTYRTPEEEIDGVGAWLAELREKCDVCSDNIAIFVRNKEELPRARAAFAKAGFGKVLKQPLIATMEEAKGLEYRAVAVMACDADTLPSPERLREIDLIAGMDEVYDTERNLFYVACTRARDFLHISSGGTPSELLQDME